MEQEGRNGSIQAIFLGWLLRRWVGRLGDPGRHSHVALAQVLVPLLEVIDVHARGPASVASGRGSEFG